MNKIFLYNTSHRKKEEFKPIKKSKVSFYYCGPTVYWTQHIGNLRGSFCADLARRVFEYNGYKVKFVRNYTDVGHLTSDEDEGEDKINKSAKRENLSPEEIAEKYIKIFEQDTSELNIIDPTFKPSATEHIKEMQAMVKILLEKGYAYATPLAIYFDISKVKDYTALSGQKLEKNIAGEGKGEVSDPGKKNPHDFAVWFFKAGVHEKALQYWPSPFVSPLTENGNGFPGWHIECSAMAKKYLDETIDVHMGGIEHISVHHTNEIAQSEAANGKKFVNYWLHNEHLLANDRKMSKSEGTGFSLSEVKEKGFEPVVLRYFFLGAHYRSKQNFTWQALESSRNGLDWIYNKIRELGNKIGSTNQKYKESFLSAINDDFNAPEALAIFINLLKSGLPPEDKLATALDFDNVLGINIYEEIMKKEEDLPGEIRELVKKRKEARAEKKWEESDKLRVEIESKGYVVKDGKNKIEVYKK